MGRKSSIDKLAAPVRAHIEKRLRENRLTLDELIEDLRERFPGEQKPSRSAVGRYRKGFDEILRSQREINAASAALVAELGENFDDKSGALLAQAVTTLATNAAHDALAEGGTEITDILDLARAAKYAQETRALNLKERQAVAREARERLLEEQRVKLDALGKSGEVDAETLSKVIQAAYGL
jgi:molybdopterin converting factor small subunit